MVILSLDMIIVNLPHRTSYYAVLPYQRRNPFLNKYHFCAKVLIRNSYVGGWTIGEST